MVLLNIPKRWEMTILMLSGIVVVYTLRVNMSVAAQKMREDLDWSETEKGLVLSSFYWGYTVGQLPASRLAQQYGAKWLFGWSVLIPSVLTMLVPIACRTSFALAILIRVAIGFFESATFPAVFHFFPLWVAEAERTFMIPFIVSGMYFGEIIGFAASGYLASSTIVIGGYDYGDWPSIFYVFGILGVLWFPLWALLAHESPDTHPTITQEEYLFVKRGKNIFCASEKCSTTNPLLQKTEALTDEEDDSSELAGDQNDEESEGSKVHSEHGRQGSSRGAGYTAVAVREEEEGSQPAVGSRRAKVKQDQQEQQQQSSSMSAKEYAAGTPWGIYFQHPVSLTLFASSFTYGWIGFTLLSEMPSFLTDELGFDLQSAGFLSMFPYLALFLSSMGMGKLFTHMQDHHGWTVTMVRQRSMILMFLGCAAGLVICGFMPDKYAAYTFLILTQVCFSAAQCGHGCAFTDVAPNYSSALNTMGNTVGASAGIVGPIVVSALLEAFPGAWGWRAAFLLTALLCVVVLALWLAVMRFEIIPELNNPRPPAKARR